MTDEQKEQIGAEIDNEGFDYWIVNYGVSSLKENNAPQDLIDETEKVAKLLDDLEQKYIDMGLIFT